MKTSRNDPCPCGSGKKYKACCMGRDEARAQVVRTMGEEAVAAAEEHAEEAARLSPVWEADVVPLTGGTFTETGTPGALALVGAAGYILASDVLGRRPIGTSSRAQVVLAAVMSAGRDAGVLPERLHVRDPALADGLRTELERRGMQVEVAPLAELDQAVDAGLERLTGSVAAGRAFTLWAWAETEASPEELAEFHAAAAEYHRAAPWRMLPDGAPLLLTFPGEDRPWAVSVMGGAGIHYGLALYSDAEDVEMLYEGPDDTDAHVGAMDGYSLSMSYDAPGDLPRPMRREVAAAGWEVAGQDAYPTLMAVCIPGRRITPEQVRRTALACRTVTAFVRAQPERLPWTAPTGVAVDLLFAPDEPDGLELPWPIPQHAHPVGPAGPNADPEATLRVWAGEWEAYGRAEIDRMERFSRWVRRKKPSRAAYDREIRAATLWHGMLISHGIPAQSVTEFELRTFLYLYLPSERYAKPVGAYLTRSLRRLFGYYAEKEGIEYPWADGVLDELDSLAAGAGDVRDVLEDLREALPLDLVIRALRPTAEVPGTPAGWAVVLDEQSADLRHDLHRRWLAWHDEVVRSGITDLDDLRDVLVGRQRQWENTPNPRLGGRTPKQVLMEMHERVAHLTESP